MTRPAPLVPGDLFARHQIITGLRSLADFLEANPAVPVNKYGIDVLHSVREHDDTASAAEVDRIAALLGNDVQDERHQRGHYKVTRTFGRVTYRAYYVPSEEMRRYRAWCSYVNAVTPDQDASTRGDTERAA